MSTLVTECPSLVTWTQSAGITGQLLHGAVCSSNAFFARSLTYFKPFPCNSSWQQKMPQSEERPCFSYGLFRVFLASNPHLDVVERGPVVDDHLASLLHPARDVPDEESDIVKVAVPLQRAASPRGDLHGDDLSVVGDHEALGHVGPPVGPYSGQAPAVTPHL